MIDEQKLRELGCKHMTHALSLSVAEVIEGGATILAMLDELQSLRSERTAWRVTAENAEEQKTQLQEFSKLACRALDDCSRVLTTISGVIDYDEIDQIDELNARVTNLAVQALVLNGLTHGGQLDAEIDASLKAAVKQARVDALEEARKAVDDETLTDPQDASDDAYNAAVYDCVQAIRSLKETP